MQPKPEYPLQIFLLSSELCLKSFSLNMMHIVIKWHLITIAYGARVRGSVFNIKFRILAREFESIETYPGFVLLREENGMGHKNCR